MLTFLYSILGLIGVFWVMEISSGLFTNWLLKQGLIRDNRIDNEKKETKND